jgi:aquaporin Z
MMRRYLSEFIGTFFLALTIGTTVRAGAALAPLAIGLALAAMVFAGGHVSGGHFNPAVTLAVWIRGKIAASDVPGYVLAQVGGALAAGYVARALVTAGPAQPFSVSGRIAVAFTAEALLTFALAFVVLNVATSLDHPGNSFYGLAIGGTVTAGAVAVGGVSGGVFNPAVAFGAAGAGLVTWSSLWLYLVADLAGAALAALAFRVLNPAEFAPPAGTLAGGDVNVPAPRAAVHDEASAAASQRVG